MDLELNDFKHSNNNDEDERPAEASSGNESCSKPQNATEDTRLLGASQVADQNGAHWTVECIPDNLPAENTPVKTLSRLKKELQEDVCCKLKVWMLILIILILIILVIFFSIYFCSVHQEDADEKYNVADFVVPHIFRGNFTLLNKNLTLDTQSLSILKQKLTNIYNSSYALGRYFSVATVNTLRNSGSSVEYELKFIMPEDHKQLIQFTLSKEMVYSVLLQQLYDQDPKELLYIMPSSLNMEVAS